MNQSKFTPDLLDEVIALIARRTETERPLVLLQVMDCEDMRKATKASPDGYGMGMAVSLTNMKAELVARLLEANALAARARLEVKAEK